MSLQIRDIVLYNALGNRRVIALRPGSVNIITGGAKTGKTALIDIIDYCLGREVCAVPEGVILDTVAWYALRLQVPGLQVFVARQAPSRGKLTTNQAYIQAATQVEIPQSVALTPNTNIEAVVEYLTRLVGIGPNIHETPDNQTRLDLEANIRHALFYAFQGQYEIANRDLLFHRQAEDFIPQAIKDTLPYFLGAAGEELLDLETQLRNALRTQSMAERRLREAEQVQGRGWSRVQELLFEARDVGLLGDGPTPVAFGEARALLETALSWSPRRISDIGGNQIEQLQEERHGLLQQASARAEQIRAARSYAAGSDGYSTEVQHQQLRLESIDLFDDLNANLGSCPLCSSRLEVSPPSVEVMRARLAALRKNLDAAARERPVLQDFINTLQGDQDATHQRIREIERTIDSLTIGRDEAERIRDLNAQKARVVGRISLYLESVAATDELGDYRRDVNQARANVARLQALVAAEQEDDLLASALSVISHNMSTWAASLELEHSDSPVRLDLNRLTLVVDRPNRPIPMYRMGSGANWVGYHLIAHLALHTWFVQKQRPVPGFLLLDQPTQAYFPSDRDSEMRGSETTLLDSDREAVKRMFDLLFSVTAQLSGELQVVVMDHANLSDHQFQSAVIENWRDGLALIPDAWYRTSRKN